MADWGQPEAPAPEQVNNQGNDDQAAGAPDATGADRAQKGWVQPQTYDYAAYNASGPGTGDNWDGSATVYEWDGQQGEIGPVFPELEAELFGNQDTKDERATGIDFSVLGEFEVDQEGPTRLKPVMKFDEAGLHPAMRRNVELAGYDVPTPIQMFCMPAIREGYDVIAIAQTGSGKTAAYLVPIIDKLMGKAKQLSAPRPNPLTYDPRVHGTVRAEPLVVIVCPARELAIQIFNEARKFCYRSMLRPCVIYGGGPIGLQIQQLSRGCDILIASPGRLIDFMDRPEVLTLRRVRYMVIDEADEMLHDDWSEEFEKIMSGGEQEEGNINYLLFSATFPKRVRDLAKTHLAENHVRLRVGRPGSTHKNIQQIVIHTTFATKRQALVDRLVSLPPSRTIIFVNSKAAADELDDFLFSKGFPCTSMHASRTQKEREDAMRAFRGGDAPILITTSVAARGIDVRNVMHVVNYDLPSMDYGGIEDYVHRIGRTGRIGHRGLSTSFYTDKDEPIASVLTRTLLETKQHVPDFLHDYIPEGWTADGEKVDPDKEDFKFEGDSDFEEEDGGDAGSDGADGGDGWGAGGDAAGGGWGAGGDDDAANSPAAANGWGSGGGGW